MVSRPATYASLLITNTGTIYAESLNNSQLLTLNHTTQVANTTVTLTSVELDTDFFYDVFHDEAQAELNAFVGKQLDVSERLAQYEEYGDSADDALFAAVGDTLVDLTGLLPAWVEYETN